MIIMTLKMKIIIKIKLLESRRMSKMNMKVIMRLRIISKRSLLMIMK